MELADAYRSLRVLRAAYPTFPFEPGTADVYAAALAQRIDDAGDADAAVTHWVCTQDRFPTVSQLLAACRAQDRHRRLQLVAEPEPLAPVPPGAFDEARARLRPKGETA